MMHMRAYDFWERICISTVGAERKRLYVYLVLGRTGRNLSLLSTCACVERAMRRRGADFIFQHIAKAVSDCWKMNIWSRHLWLIRECEWNFMCSSQNLECMSEAEIESCCWWTPAGRGSCRSALNVVRTNRIFCGNQITYYIYSLYAITFLNDFQNFREYKSNCLFLS